MALLLFHATLNGKVCEPLGAAGSTGTPSGVPQTEPGPLSGKAELGSW